MAVPIEFFLDFTMDSSKMSRAMSESKGAVSMLTESVEVLKARSQNLVGAIGTDAGLLSQYWANLSASMQQQFGSGLFDENGNAMSTFAKSFQKKVVDEFNASMSNMKKNFNSLGEGINFANASEALAKLRLNPDTREHFNNFAKDLADFQQINAKLDQDAVKPMLDLIDKINDPDNADQMEKLV